jgi:hypothetical protein
VGLVNYRVKDLVNAAPTRIVHVSHIKRWSDPKMRLKGHEPKLENQEEKLKLELREAADPLVQLEVKEEEPPKVKEEDSQGAEESLNPAKVEFEEEGNPLVGEIVPGDFEVERVEKITKLKRGHKFVEQYLVKWKGVPASENSWVASSQIDAPILIAECRARRKAEIALQKLQVSDE